MRAFFVLFRLRTLDVMRGGTTFTLFMTLPLVLLAVIAIVFSNGHPFERKEVLVVTLEGGAADARAVEARLGTSAEVRLASAPDEAFARARLRTRMASAVIVAGSTTPKRLRLIAGPRDEIFARGLAAALVGHDVQTEVEPVPRWGYVHYLFPGLLTLSVLLAGLFGMGYAMVRYRATLLLKKLATTPLSRSTFVAAQVAARAALVLVQIVSMVVAGRFAFDLPLSIASGAWLFVITVLGLLVFTGVGFAMACVIKSETLMVDMINALTAPLVFFSEIFFPVSELPSWLGAACGALPSTAMVRLTRDVLLFGVTDATRLGPGLLQLAAWAIAAYGVAIASFKWHR